MSEIPPIPYTEEELKKAKDFGASLILRIGEDGSGTPMTIEHMAELTAPWIEEKGLDRLFEPSGYIEGDEVYTSDTPKLEWKLVGDSFPTHSEEQEHLRYFLQTQELRRYLDSLGVISEDVVEESSDDELAILAISAGIDWSSGKIRDEDQLKKQERAVLDKLSSFAINARHRRSAVEIVYDWVVQLRKNDKSVVMGESVEDSRSFSQNFPEKYITVGDITTGGIFMYPAGMEKENDVFGKNVTVVQW